MSAKTLEFYVVGYGQNAILWKAVVATKYIYVRQNGRNVTVKIKRDADNPPLVDVLVAILYGDLKVNGT